MSKESCEFVAALAQALPQLSPYGVSDLARKLMRWGRTIGRLAEAECNRELSQVEHQDESNHRKYIFDACAPHGILVRFGGDPRGYTVKLVLPTGRHNTLGGPEDGWGVPNS